MSEPIVTKRCPKCNTTKPYSEFQKDKTRKDGHQGLCKTCKQAHQKVFRQTHKYKIYQRQYQQTEAYKKAVHKWRQTAAGKASQLASVQRYQSNYPERVKAGNAINHAIRSGKLERPSRQRCIICRFRRGKDYHHPDYNKPLFVFPVCKICHRLIHNC